MHAVVRVNWNQGLNHGPRFESAQGSNVRDAFMAANLAAGD
jgi:hypothetical protein